MNNDDFKKELTDVIEKYMNVRILLINFLFSDNLKIHSGREFKLEIEGAVRTGENREKIK